MKSLQIMPGAEPFLLKGGARGILLIHGFTGTPAEMRLLGEHLHEKDFTVLAIRLPGHGTEVQDMETTNWRHWYGAAVDGFHLLTGLCTEISVVGLSMGGLLALKLASEYPVARVAALSTPIFLTARRIPLLSLYRAFRRYIPKKRRDYDIDPRYYIGYDSTPLSSLSSLLELIQSVQDDLPNVHCPSLIIQSRREHTVRPESATFILEHLGAQEKELLWLEKSGHVITVDMEREKVFAKVAEFLLTTFIKE
jgi:carboxylesterase